MEKYVLIVAAGEGIRFNNNNPKQFVKLNGKPLLFHTIDAFLQVDESLKCVLVLPCAMTDYWNKLCKQHQFNYAHHVIAGGETRQHSVLRGLKIIPDNSIVAIHDGVRPLVSKRLIEEGFSLAKTTGNAVPVYKIPESIREILPNGSRAVNRDNYRLVQTPQFFRTGEIKNAYTVAGNQCFTDDASLFEKSGHKLSLFEGEKENIKITVSSDLIMVETILKNWLQNNAK